MLGGRANPGITHGVPRLIRFRRAAKPHVTYCAAAPYYYQWFQTTNGYNGHFGYPAAAQYADPPPVSRHYYPRPARRLEAFD